MNENVQSVKEEILDRFEQKLEENEEIPREVVALLKNDYDTDSFGEDEEVREVIEQIVSENSGVNRDAD
jgi:hypothetical protein